MEAPRLERRVVDFGGGGWREFAFPLFTALQKEKEHEKINELAASEASRGTKRRVSLDCS